MNINKLRKLIKAVIVESYAKSGFLVNTEDLGLKDLIVRFKRHRLTSKEISKKVV